MTANTIKKKSVSISFLSYSKYLLLLMKPRVMSLVIFTCAVGLLTAPVTVSFLNSIEKKQIKELDSLEKKIIKSQKKIYQSDIKKISTIRNKIFFNGKLMERKINFSEYYSYHGRSFMDKLYRAIDQYSSNIILVEI